MPGLYFCRLPTSLSPLNHQAYQTTNLRKLPPLHTYSDIMTSSTAHHESSRAELEGGQVKFPVVDAAHAAALRESIDAHSTQAHHDSTRDFTHAKHTTSNLLHAQDAKSAAVAQSAAQHDAAARAAWTASGLASAALVDDADRAAADARAQSQWSAASKEAEELVEGSDKAIADAKVEGAWRKQAAATEKLVDGSEKEIANSETEEAWRRSGLKAEKLVDAGL